MSKKISGAEYPLSKIFSSDFGYVIPPYQRPYAWTPQFIDDRQKKLIQVMIDNWELDTA